ncbi:MAG TPA: 2-dehydropantoate 2-reductase [Myxococcota bacterium]|nr:2-dehydropantoate 2-reductase [Myxococcota bacterium]
MRYVVFGAGAIGGAVGAGLHRAGREVVLVARGAHLEALRRGGLELRTPSGSERLALRVVGAPAELGLRADDVALLAAKTQDVPAALDAIRAGAGGAAAPAVVCLQNGLEAPRMALRCVEHVLGAMLMLPAAHLEPGVVEVYSDPCPGIVDVGRMPAGVDALAESIAADLRAAGFASEVRADLRRWQAAKLLSNLANALQAACGADLRGLEDVVKALRAEAEACFRAAGIECVGDPEMAARVAGRVTPKRVGGRPRAGGSSWQSLARGSGTIETDYLNGEIALLGRLHDVPTPVNAALQRLAARLARERRPPGEVPPDALRAALGI